MRENEKEDGKQGNPGQNLPNSSSSSTTIKEKKKNGKRETTTQPTHTHTSNGGGAGAEEPVLLFNDWNALTLFPGPVNDPTWQRLGVGPKVEKIVLARYLYCKQIDGGNGHRRGPFTRRVVANSGAERDGFSGGGTEELGGVEGRDVCVRVGGWMVFGVWCVRVLNQRGGGRMDGRTDAACCLLLLAAAGCCLLAGWLLTSRAMIIQRGGCPPHFFPKPDCAQNTRSAGRHGCVSN